METFNEMTNPVGRPTKYNQAMQEKADAYLLNWSERDAVPSRVGLCCYLGIDKATSFEWAKIHPQFSATLKAVETLQEYCAINKGITGVFNSTIVKLILANHGYSDKIEQDLKSSDGTMTPPSKIELYAVEVSQDQSTQTDT